ncbi:hypothetical protein RUND412_007933 [Rhizina undulata]
MPLALFSFHHLLSSKKVTALQALSKKLSLRGVYKKGYPGLLFVSSMPPPAATSSSAAGDDHRDADHGVDSLDVERENVAVFVREVKSMRWQTCLLRRTHGHWRLESGDWRRGGLKEVGKVRDVIGFARERGGEEVAEWVKDGLGLGPGEG